MNQAILYKRETQKVCVPIEAINPGDVNKKLKTWDESLSVVFFERKHDPGWSDFTLRFDANKFSKDEAVSILKELLPPEPVSAEDMSFIFETEIIGIVNQAIKEGKILLCAHCQEKES